MQPEHTRIEQAVWALQDQLLRGPVQLTAGPQAGGIAGTLSADGTAVYVYGEITGYYLHWLASLHSTGTAVTERAALSVQWLGQYLDTDTLPLTRQYLEPDNADWRNQACFAFDLGMIAGGLAALARNGIWQADRVLLTTLLQHLARFVANDQLLPVLVTTPEASLPRRWSTLGGPFMAKTASRILQLKPFVALPAPLEQACRNMLDHYAAMAERFAPEMLHPTLYALEGCLLAGDAYLPLITKGFEAVIQLQGADGSLPESPDNAQPYRSDIIAQALRVGVLLEQRLQMPGRFQPALDQLATCLCQRITAIGYLPFDPATSNQPNTWCAMFAEQALRLYRAMQQNQPLPFTAEDLV